jgi:hypothetical protein
MAAADNLGTICGILPPGPFLMMLCFLWVLLGCHHLIIVVSSLMGGFLEGMDDWGLSPSCQGHECHEEWRDQFMSCEGLYRSTYRIRYLTVGIGGIFFGIVGFQGVLNRSEPMVKSFVGFWVFMIVLLLLLFIADNAYVSYCEYLPRSMQLDIELLINPHQRAMMRAMGYNDLTRVHPDKITKFVGYDWHSLYIGGYLGALALFSHWCWVLSSYATNVDEGPVGLGANFVISNEPNREIQVMANRMNEAFEDYMDSVPHFQSFPQLEAGNAFPYLKKGGYQKPSIADNGSKNYGSMGIPRPPPPQD